MSDFEVATEELARLAKKIGAASKALGGVATRASSLNLPSDAFGRLSDSGAVAESYATLQQALTDRAKKGSTVLDGVDRGLVAVAKRFRDQDVLATSTFTGE